MSFRIHILPEPLEISWWIRNEYTFQHVIFLKQSEWMRLAQSSERRCSSKESDINNRLECSHENRKKTCLPYMRPSADSLRDGSVPIHRQRLTSSWRIFCILSISFDRSVDPFADSTPDSQVRSVCSVWRRVEEFSEFSQFLSTRAWIRLPIGFDTWFCELEKLIKFAVSLQVTYFPSEESWLPRHTLDSYNSNVKTSELSAGIWPSIVFCLTGPKTRWLCHQARIFALEGWLGFSVHLKRSFEYPPMHLCRSWCHRCTRMAREEETGRTAPTG